MPRVFRQQYTAPIPENAQPATATDRRGRRVPGVRFRGLNNKAVIAPLTQDGTRCRLISDYWYGNVPDPEVPGGRRRVKLSTNKVAAEVMLAEKVRKAAQKGAGMTDPFEEQVKRPLEEHLAEWEEHLRTSTRGKRGRPPSDKHVQRTLARVRRVLDGCGFRFPRGISFASVQKFCLVSRTSVVW